MIALVCATLLFSPVPANKCQWNNDSIIPDNTLYKEGDFIIGGLLPLTCSGVGYNRAETIKIENLLQVQTFLYAVQEINNDSTILSQYTLGWDIRDTCTPSMATNCHVMNFIEVAQNGYAFCSAGISAGDTDSCVNAFNDCEHKPVVGIVGPLSSDTSIGVAALLNVYDIPMVRIFFT